MAALLTVLGGVLGVLLPTWLFTVYLHHTGSDTRPEVYNVGTFEASSCRRTWSFVFVCDGQVEWDEDPVQRGRHAVEDVEVRTPERLARPTRVEWRKIERGYDRDDVVTIIPEGSRQGDVKATWGLLTAGASIAGLIVGPLLGNLLAAAFGWVEPWWPPKERKAKRRSRKIPTDPLQDE